MIKILSVSIAALLLQGCFYQTIDGVEIDKAISLCNSVDSKVWEVKEHFIAQTTAKCTNGEHFNLDYYKGE